MTTRSHRILLTFPQNSYLAKTMIQDVRDAFMAHGHTCTILDYSSLGNDLSQYKPALFDAPFQQVKPSLFFTIDDYGITNAMLLSTECLCVSWIVQPPETCLSSISPLHVRSRTYVPLLFSERYLPFMSTRGFTHPLTLENATHYARLSRAPFDHSYAHDVAFVGAFNPHRNAVLASIDSRFTVHVYGAGEWKLPPHITVHNEDCDYATIVPRIYRSSKIVLNITQWESPNQRLFDVPAAQGFLLTDKKPFIARLFPNECMATYISSQDLNDKIDYFLTHETHRRSHIERTAAHIALHHTYEKRIHSLLATIETMHPRTKEAALEQSLLAQDAYHHACAVANTQDHRAVKELLRIAAHHTGQYHDALIMMATSLTTPQLVSHAIDMIAEEIETYPDNDRLLYTYALLVYRRHDHRAARTLAQLALRANPYALDAALLLVDCYLEDHLINDAFKILSQTIALFPNSIPALKRMYALCVLIAQTDLAQKFEMRIAALETPSTLIK